MTLSCPTSPDRSDATVWPWQLALTAALSQCSPGQGGTAVVLAPPLSARRCLRTDLPLESHPHPKTSRRAAQSRVCPGCSALGTHACRTPSTRLGAAVGFQGNSRTAHRRRGRRSSAVPTPRVRCPRPTLGTGKSPAAARGRSSRSERWPSAALSLPALLPAPRCHWRCSAASLRSRQRSAVCSPGSAHTVDRNSGLRARKAGKAVPVHF